MTATADEVQAWLEGDHDTRTEAYGFARQLLAALQAVERLREREAQIWNGDYCEHGLDCTGTGPDCAKAGTLQEAYQRGWDEAVALASDARNASSDAETGQPTPPRCPTCGSATRALEFPKCSGRTQPDPWHAGQTCAQLPICY